MRHVLFLMLVMACGGPPSAPLSPLPAVSATPIEALRALAPTEVIRGAPSY